MGCEFGQWREWNHDRSLDWQLLEDAAPHAGIRQPACATSTASTDREPALYRDGLRSVRLPVDRLQRQREQRGVVPPPRRAIRATFVVVVLNFTPVVRPGYRVGVPEAGHYRELLNSDSEIYGGSNHGNAGGVESQPAPAHGHGHRLDLRLPPLSALYLKKV